MATSLAVINATREAVEAVSWMTPSKSPGMPMASRSHSIIRCSSSAAAGEVSQIMHWAPMAEVRLPISDPFPGMMSRAGLENSNFPSDHHCVGFLGPFVEIRSVDALWIGSLG